MLDPRDVKPENILKLGINTCYTFNSKADFASVFLFFNFAAVAIAVGILAATSVKSSKTIRLHTKVDEPASLSSQHTACKRQSVMRVSQSKARSTDRLLGYQSMHQTGQPRQPNGRITRLIWKERWSQGYSLPNWAAKVSCPERDMGCSY